MLFNEIYCPPVGAVIYCICQTLNCTAGLVIAVDWSNATESNDPVLLTTLPSLGNGSKNVVCCQPPVSGLVLLFIKTIVRLFKLVIPSMPAGLAAKNGSKN